MAAPLTTLAERSGWRKTGRYEETIALCAAFERRYRGKVRQHEFGVTPEGWPLLALAASADGTLAPRDIARKRRPVVLFQGGIHAGEIDGKDAGFWLLRELLEGRAAPGALDQVTVVFVPVFNIDGHERFGPNNRPNQNGPEQAGWRVTAHGLNLNRDYVKAEAPEMQAMLRLLGVWDPILYIDLHATDGAKFEHDVAVLVEPTNMGPARLGAAGRALRDELFGRLERRGHLPLVEFYPSFNKKDEPASGFSAWAGPPRFSTSYWPLRNRFAALVETHSWKDYATRVRATRDVLEEMLALAARDGVGWLQTARACDAADRRGEQPEAVLEFETTSEARMIEFRGYAYTIARSELSGQPWIRYDESAPRIWKVPFFERLRPKLTVDLPAGGYLVPAAWTPLVGAKLHLHGFSCETMRYPRALPLEAFRVAEASLPAMTVEGRTMPRLRGAWAPETRELPAGSLYVPAAQRGRRLLAHLLDPRGPDSLAAWGYFNVVFEQREYIEDYVIEAEARAMLARDASLKAEFERRLADPEFAKDPAARLRFFYQRHPSWDASKDLYPIYRIGRAPR